MADLGKVVVTDGGTYSAAVTYEKLTFVHYNNDAYLTLKTVKGVTPADDGVNYRLFCKSAATATTSKAGIVMPDGTTIGISNGKITVKTATQTTVGVAKGSNDITVGKDGALSLNTKFEQATALANIVAGEALKVVLGKVSKAIATTMNLDENALLKNMISGIDVNDGNTVPSSAYIHTLVDRIGMGTELSGFDNLTAAVNSVNNNLSNSRKIVQVSSQNHGLSLGYDDSGLYSVVDLTRIDIARKTDSGKSTFSSDLFSDYLVPTFVQWNENTLNSPYKAGLTYEGEGFALVFGTKNTWQTVIAWSKGSVAGSSTWIHGFNNGKDNGWGKYTVASV